MRKHPFRLAIESGSGRDELINLLAADVALLTWNGKAHGRDLQAVTIIVDGNDGLIHEIRVLMRPWPVVTFFRDAMYERLHDSVDESAWELGPKSDGPRHFTPIAIRPIDT